RQPTSIAAIPASSKVPTWKPARLYTLRRRAKTAAAHKTTPAAPPSRPIQRSRISTLPRQGGLFVRTLTQSAGFGLRLENLVRRQDAKHRIALGGCAGDLLRSGEVEPHVRLDVVGRDTHAGAMHLAQCVLGVPVAARRCALQPLHRMFVILDDAHAFSKRIAELVLRLRVAVLG